MNNQDIQMLLDLAKELKGKLTKESEKSTLIAAGIFDENFEYTLSFQALKEFEDNAKQNVLQQK